MAVRGHASSVPNSLIITPGGGGADAPPYKVQTLGNSACPAPAFFEGVRALCARPSMGDLMVTVETAAGFAVVGARDAYESDFVTLLPKNLADLAVQREKTVYVAPITPHHETLVSCAALPRSPIPLRPSRPHPPASPSPTPTAAQVGLRAGGLGPSGKHARGCSRARARRRTRDPRARRRRDE